MFELIEEPSKVSLVKKGGSHWENIPGQKKWREQRP